MLSIWECKLGGPLESRDIPPQFDALARDLLKSLYMGMTGREADFMLSSWEGTLTETERAVMHDRYPETPEYQ